MTDFNPLIFIADHAGINLADAIKEAYEQGKRDAQPKTGKWICDELYPTYAKCSICGYSDEYTYEDNYCPNCGAKMKEGEDQ